MRLADKYQPRTLDDIVGQPVTRHLKSWAANPDSRCLLLEGAGGVGKTSAAYALAAAVGATPGDPDTGFYRENGVDFDLDRAQCYFKSTSKGSAWMKLIPFKGQWNVLLVEEMEWLSPQCIRYLKDVLDSDRPKRAIVIATSNDASKFPKPFLQRFDVFQFQSGRMFAEACVERLAAIWQRETGQAGLPAGWRVWGWEGQEFSMRAALNDMGRTVDTMRGNGGVAA